VFLRVFSVAGQARNDLCVTEKKTHREPQNMTFWQSFCKTVILLSCWLSAW